MLTFNFRIISQCGKLSNPSRFGLEKRFLRTKVSKSNKSHINISCVNSVDLLNDNRSLNNFHKDLPSCLQNRQTRCYSSNVAEGSVKKEELFSENCELKKKIPKLHELPFSVEIPRGVHRDRVDYCIGQKLYGYKVCNKKFISERNLVVYELVHETTGAMHIHIASDDTENAFALTLKTIPPNNSGVAHILEHMTLCGSKNYNIRDPFFKMLKRSLNSFMNAWTGPDYTGYPFSTTNAEDYYNLMAVYLDAIFNPNLDYYDFLQEGHRLEIVEKTQGNTENYDNKFDFNNLLNFDLIHKGVVYNEMKGAMSDPDDIYPAKISSFLYPTSIYQYNYGGDPEDICKISYDDVKAFHSKFYHPSNSYTLTYGDLPLENHLQFISEKFLCKFNKIDLENNVIEREIRWDAHRRVTKDGPLSSFSDPNKQIKVSVSWLTNPIDDNYVSFLMEILSYLLLAGPNAPLYKALITSNLGNGYSPGTGYDSNTKDTNFSVGITDVDESTADRIESIIIETLEQVSKEGFAEDRIETVLHKLEFMQKNVTTGFGLYLLQNVVHEWIHGISPIRTLSISENLDRFRKDYKESKGEIFKELIRDQLLKNPHRLTFKMVPEPEYSKKLQDKIDENLNQIKNDIYKKSIVQNNDNIKSDNNFKNDFERILFESSQLKLAQEQIEDPKTINSILPRIHIESISKVSEIVTPSEHFLEVGHLKIPFYFNDQPTNGIAFYRASFDVSDIPGQFIKHLPIVSSIMHKVGTPKYDYKELSQKKDIITGSFSVDEAIVNDPNDLSKYSLKVDLSSSCLSKNIESMFDLWQEVQSKPDFAGSIDHIRSIIGNISSSMHGSFIESGHFYAKMIGAAQLYPSSRVYELWNGLTMYHNIRKLNEDQSELYSQMDAYPQISDWIYDIGKLKIIVNAEMKDFDRIFKSLQKLVNQIPVGVKAPVRKRMPHERIAEFKDNNDKNLKTYVAIPSQVNYVSQCFATVPYNDSDFSRLDIMASIISSNFLHREIREKGGAYGGGLSHSPGILGFYSYRDPHIENTIDTFKKSIDWILDGSFTDEQVMEAKIAILANLDSPIPPSQKGLTFFECGVTPEMVQKRRDNVFSTNRQDIIRVCEKYLKYNPRNSIAVFGSDNNEKYKNDPEWNYKNQ